MMEIERESDDFKLSQDNDFLSRRLLLKTSFVSAASFVTASVSGKERSENGDSFPYHLDGFKTFAEYKEARRARMLPCDSVIVEKDNPSLVHNLMHCMNCGRCDEACMEQSVSHWYDRGSLKSGVETICCHCGQCITACKYNALSERLDFTKVASAISDSHQSEKKDSAPTFVALVAPALRSSIGEVFGLKPGTNLQKQLPKALRAIGFDYVLDASFGADLTTVEEARELRTRLDLGRSDSPMFTSCCPAWVTFVETFFPELIGNLSTTRSPLLAQCAAVKTMLAKEKGIDPASIVTAAFVPCVGKKYEALRPENVNASKYWERDGEFRDLDYALTTRELAAWLGGARINLPKLEEEDFDSILGVGSGSGKTFGATGGVLGAVLRQLWRDVVGTEPPTNLLEFSEIRGIAKRREATVTIGSYRLRVAVVCGLASARSMLEELCETGRLPYDFVEVMACPGGCVGGGGQPKIDGALRPTDELRETRGNTLFKIDSTETIRTSGTNPEIERFYTDFMGEPCGELAENLLHTSFQDRKVWR